MTSMNTITIDEDQKHQFREEGYFILERIIPNDHLAFLRHECDRFIRILDEEMDRRGVDVDGLNHRRKRYFISNRHKESELLPLFLYSNLMADICRATIGGNAFLFVEQFVVKFAEVGMKFAWHQDSGYIGHEHRPYLSCWCALDDVTEENGTVYILPYSRAGTKQWQVHTREEGTNDLVGYRGDDPGIPVIAPAGSIAVFSSTTFHRSGPNTTGGIRRIYLAQYSPEPILTKDGTRNWAMAEPFLRDNVRVNCE